jgi:hypothetical protein
VQGDLLYYIPIARKLFGLAPSSLSIAPLPQGSKLYWLHDDSVSSDAAALAACRARHINGTLAVVAGPSDNAAVQLLLGKLGAGGAAWLGPARNATGAWQAARLGCFHCVWAGRPAPSPSTKTAAASTNPPLLSLPHCHCQCYCHCHLTPDAGGPFFNRDGSPANSSLTWCPNEPNDAGSNCTLGLRTCPGGSTPGVRDAVCSGAASYRFICSQPAGSCAGDQAVFSGCSASYNRIWLHVDQWLNASEASAFCRQGA